MSRQLAIGILVGFTGAVGLISWAARAPNAAAASSHDAGAVERSFPYLRGVTTQKMTIGQRTPHAYFAADGGL